MARHLEAVGLTDVRITHRFDCFWGTSKETTAQELGVQGVNLFARRPMV